ncbi:unnamed protein product [Staurois parvus]|uniref:Uncharacterized protein n=1 Tax=Staurois parvus TaxID=386267 RepID=A0ABN9AV32_9NEOB|nr:unnamed protein product [Staurois parvus]
MRIFFYTKLSINKIFLKDSIDIGLNLKTHSATPPRYGDTTFAGAD